MATNSSQREMGNVSEDEAAHEAAGGEAQAGRKSGEPWPEVR
jgi:hypothetical protein